MAKRDYSNWAFLGAAVLAGGAAFWLSRMYINEQAEKAKKEVYGTEAEMIQVVVATSNLAPGDIISTKNMAFGKIPAQHVGAHNVNKANLGAVMGHVLNRPLSAGEPIRIDDVVGGIAYRLSDLLKPGERAITIEATELTSNSEMILPGDMIDIFLLYKGEGTDTKAKSMSPLADRIRVLAAGTSALRSAEQNFQPLTEKSQRYSTLTIGVSVEKAQKIMIARDSGELAVVLRNSTDRTRNTQSVDLTSNMMGAPGGYKYFSMTSPAGQRRTPNTIDGYLSMISLPIAASNAEAAGPKVPPTVAPATAQTNDTGVSTKTDAAAPAQPQATTSKGE